MLTPEYLASCTDGLLGLYDALDRAIIADISRRIIKTGDITDTAALQAKRAQQSGMLLNDVIDQVARTSGRTQEEIRRLFAEAGVTAVKNDAAPLVAAGLAGNVHLSGAMNDVLTATMQKTAGDIRNLSLTTALQAQTAYIEAVDRASMKVQSGAFSYSEAIFQAIREAATDGNFIMYPSGHRDRLDVAIRRATLTGVNQTCARLTEMYSRDMGAEYYEVSAHSGARPSHAAWQGRVYKIDGHGNGYENFYDATHYGSGDGLCGWNCRHSFYPFWPGISSPAYTPEKLEWYNARRFEYNGRSYTDYECSQIQRAYERKIRESKRRLAGYDAAIKEGPDPATAKMLQEKFEAESVQLKSQEGAMKKFCEATGRRVDGVRTRVVAHTDPDGRIVGFGRSPSAKAVWANKKSLQKAAERGNVYIERQIAAYIDNPSTLGKTTPAEKYEAFIEHGVMVQPLNRGSLKGKPYKEGGGYRINDGKDGYFQYHPANKSHHGAAYYKLSSGKSGTKRYDLDGNLLAD